MIPAFMDLLQRMAAIHNRKSADYAAPTNPFENFERSAEIASWFSDPVDKSFVVLIGTKLARLATLLGGNAPQNESIDDSFLDLCTYCALWASYRKSVGELLPPVSSLQAPQVSPSETAEPSRTLSLPLVP